MPEIEFFGEIEEIQKNPDGVIRLTIIVRKAYSDAINRDRWLDIQSLYPGVETGFKIKQKEVILGVDFDDLEFTDGRIIAAVKKKICIACFDIPPGVPFLCDLCGRNE